MHARSPAATYRLQLTAEFRFADARELVPYLSRLGVTHLYSSPILRARGGSAHGYDVVDPATVSPDLGEESGFRALVESLRAHGMGLMLDIVPNHMAAVAENPYWRDVLTFGIGSRYARWFDIDWRLPDPESWGRVLVPVLGEPLPKIIAQDQLRMVWDHGRFTIHYYDHAFPVDPATVPDICRFRLEKLTAELPPDHPGLVELRGVLARLAELPRHKVRMRRRQQMDPDEVDAALSQLARVIEQSPSIRQWAVNTAEEFAQGEPGRRRMKKLIDAQSYRLVYWRQAARAINYRRFFDINDLVSVRQEDPDVFDETHAAVARLIGDNLVDGLRIDHIDGLRDPKVYLERLRQLATDREHPELPIFVEKILSHDEQLPADWPVQGTTGYDFLGQVEGLFVSAEGFGEILDSYRRLLRRPLKFPQVATWGKRRVLRNELSSFVGRLAELLLRIAHRDPQRSHLTQRGLVDAIVETVVGLPVYRTYLSGVEGTLNSEDRQRIETALSAARRSHRADTEAIDFLAEVLRLAHFETLDEQDRHQRLNFIQRLQQITGPATAKGVEDTALYAYVPLASLCEVGGEPERDFSSAAADLHAENARRAAAWPMDMLCATSHDTKRTADVRARLDALSEFPRLWQGYVGRWRKLNRPHRRRAKGRSAPDAATEYLFYQSLAGIWPAADPRRLEESFPGGDEIAALRERLEGYMLKAAREAKTRTSWVDGSSAFEEALVAFVRSVLLAGDATSPFLHDVHNLVARIARPGFWNSLSRETIRLTSPGTPDIYQGDELWNFALVDPDNRRPVDYDVRRRRLDEVAASIEAADDERLPRIAEWLDQVEDGRVKLHVIRSCLLARRNHPALFAAGDYRPLTAKGEHAEHVFAFLRMTEDAAALVVAPRLTVPLVGEPGLPPLGRNTWKDTAISLAEELPALSWQNSMTLEQISPSEEFFVGDILARLPAAVLIAKRMREDNIPS